MAELTALAVEDYTQGRLNRDDPETVRLLAAALRAAQRYCGWHVTPEVPADEVTLDGPGGRLLVLPTLRLVDLVSVIEDGVELDVTALDWSARGLVQKQSGLGLSVGSSLSSSAGFAGQSAYWSSRFRGITAVIRHGYDDAEDFNSALLSVIDRFSLAATGGRANVVGPFQYPVESFASGSPFSVVEKSLLDQYRLERPA